MTKKDGKEQVKFTQFYEALLEAKGLTFATGTAGIGKGEKAFLQGSCSGERKPSHRQGIHRHLGTQPR